jgi:YfiH family protein
MGLTCGDDEASVLENRDRLATALSVAPSRLVFAEQVHGSAVAVVDGEADAPIVGADALITRVPDLVLTMLFADCVPIYIVDPVKRVAALVHSGWRGTEANIVANTTCVMKEQFDVLPRICQVAIGPSISGENYEVGREVADRFRFNSTSGASTPVMPKNEITGSWTLNLRAVVFGQLLNAGYRAQSIAVCDEDTFANRRDFFSHRRESLAGRKTGRMAAYLALSRSYS